ncbi:MAG: hypothetical protein LUD41_02045, partial [Phascolarctobacterium sp.]|nr:hypothetical protein [Phascolarctobacterium sp.]
YPPRYGFVCELYSTTDSIAMDFSTVQLHFTIGHMPSTTTSFVNTPYGSDTATTYGTTPQYVR